MNEIKKGIFAVPFLALAALSLFIFSACPFGAKIDVKKPPPVYTITYNLNGGNGTTPGEEKCTAGDSVTLASGNGFSRNGYTFEGWNTNSSGSGTNYNAGAQYTPARTITLYAKWAEIPPPQIDIDMVWVPGGTFRMGNRNPLPADDARGIPVHDVTVSGFWIGKYAITQAQYQAATGTNPVASNGAFNVGDNKPVTFVNWYDAVEFCNRLSEGKGLTPYYTVDKGQRDPSNTNADDNLKWLVTGNQNANGFRLPTEAEWEHAARGGNSSDNLYSGSNNAGEVAWHGNPNGNSGSQMHDVGTKNANRLGIYDMSGNAWEWCWDWFGSYSSGAQTNPEGPSSGSSRTARGGSYMNNAGSAAVHNRANDLPPHTGGASAYIIGFRIALPERGGDYLNLQKNN